MIYQLFRARSIVRGTIGSINDRRTQPKITIRSPLVGLNNCARDDSRLRNAYAAIDISQDRDRLISLFHVQKSDTKSGIILIRIIIRISISCIIIRIIIHPK